MTLEEAIRILSDSYYKHTILLAGRDDEALKLGIEALKAWQSSRQFSSVHQVPLLLGETKE